MEWVNTDETQWIKRLDSNLFEVVDVVTYNGYYVKHVKVDFDSLTDEEIQSGICGFYHSLDNVKEIYGDCWMQIVAECIAENEPMYNQCAFFKKSFELKEYLRGKFGIQGQIKP